MIPTKEILEGCWRSSFEEFETQSIPSTVKYRIMYCFLHNLDENQVYNRLKLPELSYTFCNDHWPNFETGEMEKRSGKDIKFYFQGSLQTL